jgi:hypothetical protein
MTFNSNDSKDDDTMQAPLPKLAKNQFRCFKCRAVFPQKEGDWFSWEHMQVHLCIACARKTADHKERK